jgi:hypothetical protein
MIDIADRAAAFKRAVAGPLREAIRQSEHVVIGQPEGPGAAIAGWHAYQKEDVADNMYEDCEGK